MVSFPFRSKLSLQENVILELGLKSPSKAPFSMYTLGQGAGQRRWEPLDTVIYVGMQWFISLL